MRCAVLQLNSQEDQEANLEQVRYWVQEAAAQGAELVLLPEGFAFLGLERQRRQHAESFDEPGPVLQSLSHWSREFGLYLIAGGFPECSHDSRRPYNTSVVYDPRGERKSFYRKVHLFRVHLEDGTVLDETKGSLAGDSAVVTTVADSKGESFSLGLSICYDLRFPQFYQAQRNAGAEILTVPAAFTATTGRAHWQSLLRARAIENQSWVLAAAQEGQHPGGRSTYGHSMIIDPWGRVVRELKEGPGLVIANLSKQSLAEVREQMPVAEDRREFDLLIHKP
ncbi:MAG: carbon-nitrogen hydrolase family protein [Polyangiaceae bacterium]|nr:carbon-nitrogen hydrolase family protein [Polyangiaceae bacterium]